MPLPPHLVAGIALAVLAVTNPPTAAAFVPADYGGKVVHVTFEGSGQTSRESKDPGGLKVLSDVSWHAEYDVTVPDVPLGFPDSLRTHVVEGPTTVTGTSKVQSQAGNCEGPIVAKPVPTTPFIGVYGNPPDFTADPPPVVTLYIDAFGGYDYDLCGGLGGIGDGPFAPAGGGLSHTFAVLIAKFNLDLNEWANQPSHQSTIPVGESELKDTASEKASVQWSGTITLSSSSVVFDPLKQDARAKLRSEFSQAIAPCLTLAGGVGVIIAGGPAIGSTAGATMVTISAPVCAFKILMMRRLADIYRDPPDPNFDEVAKIVKSARPVLTLPSCLAFTGKDRRACKKLEAAAVKYADKDQRILDIVESFWNAANRFSGAVAAADAKATKRQFRAAIARDKKMLAAFDTRAKAGAKLAGLLLAAGATGPINASQYADGAEIVIDKLGELGLADPDARALAGDALTPRDADALVLLGQP